MQKTLPKIRGKKPNVGLYRQAVRCGKLNCRCSSGELHKGYFYLMWREAGKQRKRYVPLRFVAELRAAMDRIRSRRDSAEERTRTSLAELREVRARLRAL